VSPVTARVRRRGDRDEQVSEPATTPLLLGDTLPPTSRQRYEVRYQASSASIVAVTVPGVAPVVARHSGARGAGQGRVSGERASEPLTRPSDPAESSTGATAIPSRRPDSFLVEKAPSDGTTKGRRSGTRRHDSMPAWREHIVFPHRVLGVESQWATRAPWSAGVLIERDGRIWCSFPAITSASTSARTNLFLCQTRSNRDIRGA
jgi:hypothetical protein